MRARRRSLLLSFLLSFCALSITFLSFGAANMEINTVPTPERVDADKESFEHHSVIDDASSIRSDALGDDLPKGYFYSVNFIGCLTVSDNGLQSVVFEELSNRNRGSACQLYQHTSSCLCRQMC